MKNTFILFFLLLSFTASAQVISWELSAQPGNQVSNSSTFQAPNINAGTLSRGAGITPATGAGSINATGWYSGATPTTLNEAIANNDYYEFTLSSAACQFFDVDSIRIVLRSSATGPGFATLRSSSDNFANNIGTFPVTTTSTRVTFNGDFTSFTDAITFRLYGYGTTAGGGNPAAGGTFRIGSSINAADNDLEVFATVSPLAFTIQQSNLTVTALDDIGFIPFNTIIFGSTINWSRTAEPIGPVPLSGTGQVPGFTTTNNTGAPLVCTFTVTATLGNCVSADMLFTITVNPPPPAVPCSGAIAAWELSMEPGDQISSESFFSETGIGTGILSHGAGLTASPNPQGMSTIHWFDSNVATTLAQAIANNDYYEITLPVDATHQATVTGIRFILRGNSGSPKNLALRSSADNFAANLATGVLTLNTTVTNFNFTAVTQTNGTLIFRLYGFGGAISSNSQPNPNAGILLGYSSTPASPDICVFGSTSTVTCAVTDIGFTNIGTCNNNGTPQNTNDDFYTLNVNVDFTLPPGGSNLILESSNLIGSYSIPVANLSGNTHTFTGVMARANGLSTSVIAKFTNAPTCGTQSLTRTGVSSCSGICEYTSSGLDNILCNNNGTPANTADDYITFSLNPQGNNFNSGYQFSAVAGFPIPTLLDGTPAVNIPYGVPTNFRTPNGTAAGTGGIYNISILDDSGACFFEESIAAPGTCSSSAACDITTVTFTNVGTCNDNGTSNTNDDFFTANVVVNFVNPPATGNLQIEPGGDALGTNAVAVGALVGNSHTFTGVHFKADGTQTVVEVEFTIPANQCVQTQTGPTVQPCSPVCDITTVTFTNVSTCNDNGTSNISDDFFTANVVVNFVNPPATGNLQIEPGGDALGTNAVAVGALVGNSHTFTGVHFKADGTQTLVEVEFTIPANQCVQTQTGPTVQPCSPPASLTCPPNTTVNCASNVPAPQPNTVSINTFCDGGIDIAHINDVISNQTCTNRFTVTRTYQATGDCIPTLTCMQTITVQDNQFPAVSTPPANITIECGPNAEAQFQTWLNTAGGAIATDNCGGVVIWTHSTPAVSAACGNSKLYSVVFFRADICGNTEPDGFFTTFTIRDLTPPTITCPPPVTVSCSNALPVDNFSGGIVSDVCSNTATVVRISDAVSNIICANRQTVTRLYRATDACGNTATCSQTITVNDQTPPALTCPAPQVVSCAGNVPPANTALVTGTTDNCTGTAPVVAFVNDAVSNQTCANRFTVTRTYRATDACGNSATCSQMISVNDQTPPALTCPAGVTVGCASDVPPANTTLVTGVADNCGGAAPTVIFVNDAISNQTCVNRFIVSRSYRATDICGNSATCNQVIVVFDDLAPQFLVRPQNLAVSCGPANMDEYAAWLADFGGALLQECSAVTWVTEELEFHCPVYCGLNFQKRIRFTVTDECGNSNYADAEFTTYDLTPPEFTQLPQDKAVDCMADCNGDGDFYEWFDNDAYLSVTDQCGAVNLEKLLVANGNGCGNTWWKKYEFRATDACGNITKAYATFSVVDHTPPVITQCAPDNWTLTCVEQVPQPNLAQVLVTDECSTAMIALQKVEKWGDGCFSSPLTVHYTYTATDACGNISTCTQQIFVKDIAIENLTLPDTIEVTCVDDIPGPTAVATLLTAQYSTPCDATCYGLVSDLGQNGNTHTYIVKGKDNCGNMTPQLTVTFAATGTCRPLCSANNDIWGINEGVVGNQSVKTVLDSITKWYGGVSAGSFGRTLHISGADCFIDLVAAFGDCSGLIEGQYTASVSNDCYLPADLLNSAGELRSELVTNILSLQLNIWYNTHFNQRNLGIQDLRSLPTCTIDFKVMKQLGTHATWQDLLDLANEYLGAVNAYPYPEGFGELLNAAISNINNLHRNCIKTLPCPDAHQVENRFDESEASTDWAIQLSPNPATDMLTVQFYAATQTDAVISISNTLAVQTRSRISATVGSNMVSIPLSGLTNGVYYLTVQQGGQIQTVRFVKLKE